ncbi:hypothetical protein LCGC14_2913260, partial [marine sediment metagenome]
ITLTGGALTAEQLTSDDDITMLGHLMTLGDNTNTNIVITFDGENFDASITYEPFINRFSFSSASFSAIAGIGCIGLTASGTILGAIVTDGAGALLQQGVVQGNIGVIINDFTVDTSTLRVDSVNHRVGIGTITPDGEFQIGPHSASSGSALFDGFQGVSHGSLKMFAFTELTVPTVAIYAKGSGIGSGDTYFNHGGNFGIGVIDPDTTLEIFSTTTQLKLSYDATNYAQFTTGSDGQLTITTVDSDGAAGDITLSPDGIVISTVNFHLDDGIKLTLGTGNDGEIYSSSDDVIIANVTAEKDINFIVNDGGALTALSIDTSQHRVEIWKDLSINPDGFQGFGKLIQTGKIGTDTIETVHTLGQTRGGGNGGVGFGMSWLMRLEN